MRYVFGSYALDLDRQELRCGVEAIPVTPQVFDILVYLIRNRERVVSKDDLIQAIWQGRAITDAALTTRLNAVRQAIGDSGDRQDIIRTLPRKGYRFVAPVQENPDVAPASAPAIGWPTTQVSRRGRPALAIRPFAAMSGRADHMHLAGAATAAVTIDLSRLGWLDVVPHDVRCIRSDPTIGLMQFGHETGVRYVLDGGVWGTGSACRLTSRLSDMETGAIIWGGRFDDTTGTCDADDATTGSIVAAVGAAVLAAERQRAMCLGTDQLDAWQAYQRGMWHMSNCEITENALARSFFQRAIDLDPGYAAGHSAIGWSHMMSASIFSEMTIAEGCALAEPLVRRATALDENDSASHARLAIAALLKGDLAGAFEGAQDALSIDENCAEALGVRGTALLYGGHRQQGREAIQRSLELSPRDPARPIRLCQIAASLYLDGAYAAALATARNVIRRYPRHPTAYRWLVASLGQLGETAAAEEALHELQTTLTASFDMYVVSRPKYCAIEHEPLLAGLRKGGWGG